MAAASYANTSAPLITTSVTVGNATVNATVNSTSFTGTASNATNLNSQPGSYYTNATNITTGTLPYAQIPANIINTTAAFTITGVHTHNANVVIGTTAGISANGGYGTAGQGLFSNGTSVYWATVTSGATLTANTTDNQTYYFPMSNATSGSWTNAVMDTALTYNPSTDLLNVPGSINASSITVGNSVIAATINASGLIMSSNNPFFYIQTNSVKTPSGGASLNFVANGITAYQISGTTGESQFNANVGIGTSYPNTSLDVAGGVKATSYTVGNSLSNTFVVNSTVIAIGNATVNTTINATSFTGTANNATNLGGLGSSSYANTSAPLITTSVTVGNATVNVTVNSTSFTGTSSNATNLNSQPGSYYTNATNITTGTLPYAQIPANIVNTTAAFTISGVHTHNANLAVNAATFTAGNTTQGTIANSAGLYFSSSDGTACSYMTTTAVYTPNLVSPTGNPLYLKTNGVTAVTILAASQNMGIGNAAPSHTLSINGATYLGGNAIFNSGVSANGGYGTSGQVLTTNGAGVYWSSAAGGSVGGSNTQIQFNDSGSANGTAAITFNKTSNTLTLDNTSSLVVGNSTVNSYANSTGFTSQISYMNQTSLSFGTYTTNASLNMMLVGPFTINSGNSFVISTGSRIVIV